METQGKTLPWSFEQDFEPESGLKAGILEEKTIFKSSLDQVCGALGFFGKVT